MISARRGTASIGHVDPVDDAAERQPAGHRPASRGRPASVGAVGRAERLLEAAPARTRSRRRATPDRARAARAGRRGCPRGRSPRPAGARSCRPASSSANASPRDRVEPLDGRPGRRRPVPTSRSSSASSRKNRSRIRWIRPPRSSAVMVHCLLGARVARTRSTSWSRYWKWQVAQRSILVAETVPSSKARVISSRRRPARRGCRRTA